MPPKPSSTASILADRGKKPFLEPDGFFTSAGKHGERGAMPQRRGMVLDHMHFDDKRQKLVRYKALVAVLFNETPALQTGMRALLERLLRKCDEEEEILQQWWNRRLSFGNVARGVDPFSDDELRSCFRFRWNILRKPMQLLEIP